MPVTRRRLLAFGAGAAAGTLGLTACGGSTGASLGAEDQISMWAWTNSISNKLSARAAKGIPGAPGMKLQLTLIGGNYNTKVRASLAGKSAVPDIIAMNSDVATYFPDADEFLDLRSLGAEQLKSQYLDWKWQQGVAPGGKMIGFPMDTGPTALFYRRDLFRKAGLPAEPDEVAAAVRDWDAYLKFGARIRKKIPGSVVVPNIKSTWDYRLAQLKQNYMTRGGRYVGDSDALRGAWELAYRFHREGLSANAIDGTTDVQAIVANSRQVCQVGAVWWGLAFPINILPKSSGSWRVCAPPAGPGNKGGSFLGISKYAKNPKAAFALIRWLLSPVNQVQSYTEMQLFPSTPSSYRTKAMAAPQKFFGGQRTTEVFAKSAESVPGTYLSPYDTVIGLQFTTELQNMESGAKTPDRAWKDAQANVERELTRLGVG